MRDTVLRQPEYVVQWRAMLGELQNEAYRIRKMKKKNSPKFHYEQWAEGFQIYLNSIADRIAEAKNLIKIYRIEASNKALREQNHAMFLVMTRAKEHLDNSSLLEARQILIDCLESETMNLKRGLGR